MTDDAYIQPSDHELYHFQRKGDDGTFSGLVHKDAANFSVAKLRASHAVVDSIAADLAEAVDALIEAWPGVMDGQLFHKAMTASLRFDALKGKAE